MVVLKGDFHVYQILYSVGKIELRKYLRQTHTKTAQGIYPCAILIRYLQFIPIRKERVIGNSTGSGAFYGDEHFLVVKIG